MSLLPSASFLFAILRMNRLHLGLLEAVLPQGDVRGDTILTVVEEDNPGSVLKQAQILESMTRTYMASGFMDSPIRNS